MCVMDPVRVPTKPLSCNSCKNHALQGSGGQSMASDENDGRTLILSISACTVAFSESFLVREIESSAIFMAEREFDGFDGQE